MKIAARQKLQRAGLSAAAVVALLSATGCGYINPQQTAVGYSAADGIVQNLGEVELRNVLIVGAAADQQGRVLGTLVNNGDRPVTVTMDAQGATAQVQVPANGSVELEEGKPVLLDRAGADPGRMVETDFAAAGQSATREVPVLDHTFPRYAEFVPGGAPSTPANPSNTPKPVEEMVGQESGH